MYSTHFLSIQSKRRRNVQMRSDSLIIEVTKILLLAPGISRSTSFESNQLSFGYPRVIRPPGILWTMLVKGFPFLCYFALARFKNISIVNLTSSNFGHWSVDILLSCASHSTSWEYRRNYVYYEEGCNFGSMGTFFGRILSIISGIWIEGAMKLTSASFFTN